MQPISSLKPQFTSAFKHTLILYINTELHLFTIIELQRLAIQKKEQKKNPKPTTYQFNFWTKTFKNLVSFFCFFLQVRFFGIV